MTDDASERGSWRKVGRAAINRPELAVAAMGLVTAGVHVWWVHRHRLLGAYNVDEVGYMATGLRLHSSLDLSAPQAFVERLLSPSSTGPLVPFLTVPFSVLFGRGVPVLMIVQSLMVVTAAIAVAGIASRLGDRRAGVVAGVVVLTAPAMIQSARNFQYAAAAGAFLCLAVWALLSSDEGRNRRAMVAFGAAAGAMLLSRTMTLGFVPALVVATVVTVRRDGRAWRNVALATAVAGVVAGPWLVSSRQALYDYLVGFGYGSQSRFYGDAGWAERLHGRVVNVGTDLKPFSILLGAVTLVVGVRTLARVARRRTPGAARQQRDEASAATAEPASAHDSDSLRRRRLVAAVVLVVGAIALASTRNRGVWFEVPLELLIVALVVAATATFGHRTRRLVEVLAIGMGLTVFALSVGDTGGELGDGPEYTRVERLRFSLYGGLVEKQRALAVGDPRAISPDDTIRRASASEWTAANVELAERLDDLRVAEGGLTMLTMSGNSHLINSQSLLLIQSLRSLTLSPIEVPDTARPDRDLTDFLQPEWRGTHQRLLVLIRSRSLPFPEDRDTPRFERLARRRGWTEAERIPLPDGGDVVIMRHSGAGS